MLLAGAALQFARPSRARAGVARKHIQHGHSATAFDADAAERGASSPHDRYLRYLAPYPAKLRLLLEGAAHQPEPILAASDTPEPPALAGASIMQTGGWRSGSHPNYSATAVVNGERLLWVACYNSRTVTQVNVTRNTTASFGPFPAIRPLDVAYDAQRRRLVVASADNPDPREAGQARMAVLDLANGGAIIAEQDLAQHANQGPCLGGVQGVTIDARGDYWFSLAYSGELGRGVVMRIDGSTLRAPLVLRDLTPNEPIEGLSNPNGIVTAADRNTVFAFSDTGRAHQFDLEGHLLNRYITVTNGYRGAVHGGELWVAAWTPYPGALARVDLSTGQRVVYPCAPRANSVAIDGEGRVWVAGDEGLSASDDDGNVIARGSFGAFLNGLACADGDVYSTSYAYDWQYEDAVLRFSLGKPQVHLPAVLLGRSSTP